MPHTVRDRLPPGLTVHHKRDRTRPNRWVWKCKWCRHPRANKAETPYVTGTANTVDELAQAINAHVKTDQHQAYIEALEA